MLASRRAHTAQSTAWISDAPRPSQIKTNQGAENMEDHDTRRKIIREWMGLPKDKRQTEEQVVTFARRATQQDEFHRSW
jgi:hypothetical protein